MVKHHYTDIAFVLLYIHSAKMEEKRFKRELEERDLQCADAAELPKTMDKLHWDRCQKELMQREVADQIGIGRGTYSNYEIVERDYYPIDVMKRLASLYGINVLSLLDEYNVFLYNGQGKQIKALRAKQGITQRELAERMRTTVTMVKRWERDDVQVYKGTWQKLFDGRY